MHTVDPSLRSFLASLKPLATETTSWGENMPLDITLYLSSQPPPLTLVTSVRSVLFHDDSVLVVRDANNHFHIMPGGRREKNETIEETLRREVLEETGWTLDKLHLLGFMHLHHRASPPADYPYPYPDFCWLIYVSQTDKFIPKVQIPSEYELEFTFLPIDEARLLLIERSQLVLLDTAIELRSSME